MKLVGGVGTKGPECSTPYMLLWQLTNRLFFAEADRKWALAKCAHTILPDEMF